MKEFLVVIEAMNGNKLTFNETGDSERLVKFNLLERLNSKKFVEFNGVLINTDNVLTIKVSERTTEYNESSSNEHLF